MNPFTPMAVAMQGKVALAAHCARGAVMPMDDSRLMVFVEYFQNGEWNTGFTHAFQKKEVAKMWNFLLCALVSVDGTPSLEQHTFHGLLFEAGLIEKTNECSTCGYDPCMCDTA